MSPDEFVDKWEKAIDDKDWQTLSWAVVRAPKEHLPLMLRTIYHAGHRDAFVEVKNHFNKTKHP